MGLYLVYSEIGTITNATDVRADSSEKAVQKVLQANGYYGKLYKATKETAHIRVQTQGNVNKYFAIISMQNIDSFYVTVIENETTGSYKYKLTSSADCIDGQYIVAVHDAEKAKAYGTMITQYILPVHRLSLEMRLIVLNHIGVEIGKAATEKTPIVSGQMRNLLDMYAKQWRYKFIRNK